MTPLEHYEMIMGEKLKHTQDTILDPHKVKAYHEVGITLEHKQVYHMVKKGSVRLIQTLIDIHPERTYPLIYMAVATSRLDLVQYLLDNGTELTDAQKYELLTNEHMPKHIVVNGKAYSIEDYLKTHGEVATYENQ
jgi:hypothetical protein